MLHEFLHTWSNIGARRCGYVAGRLFARGCVYNRSFSYPHQPIQLRPPACPEGRPGGLRHASTRPIRGSRGAPKRLQEAPKRPRRGFRESSEKHAAKTREPSNKQRDKHAFSEVRADFLGRRWTPSQRRLRRCPSRQGGGLSSQVMAFMAPRIEEYTTFAVSSFVHMNELVQVVTANVGGVDIGSGVESAPCVFDILVGEVLALFLWLLEFVAGGVGTSHSRGSGPPLVGPPPTQGEVQWVSTGRAAPPWEAH